MENSRDAFSLYAHVPFCRGKCIYCDFYSVPLRATVSDRETATRVTREILKQARFFLEVFGCERVETAYVGGGTPSILPAGTLSELLRGLSGLGAVEWTVEANPESLDHAFLEACAESGVTRLSLGIQAGRDGLLSLLGRPGRSADNARALGLLRDFWNGEASLDFLAGIPGQEIRDMDADLSMLADSGIGHASLYSLTVEPGTGLSRCIDAGEIRPESGERAEELWFHGKEALERLGFLNYEISNFALPGRECLHNMRYWRLEPYIGVGPAAVSTVPAELAARLGGAAAREAAEARVLRISNPHDIGRFLSGREGLWGIEVEAVSDADFLLETLMMGLRTAAGIDAELFRHRFGAGFDDVLPGLRGKWLAEGLAAEDPGAFRLTGEGRLVLDRLLHEAAAGIRRGMAGSIKLQWP